MLSRPRNYTIWLIVLGCLFVAGLVLALTGNLDDVEGPLFQFLEPLQQWLGGIGQWASDVIQNTRDLSELRDRNAQLTELVNELAVENVRLKELEAENAILRDLLAYTDTSLGADFKATEVRSRVLSWEPGNLLQYIMISAGTEDGLAVGMPVVTERGLVGRIDEVYSRSARVRLVIDAGSSVNALVQRTRATGIVKGGTGRELTLDYLPQEEDVVAVGDVILTSGLGGVFPRRLVIGQVVEIVQKDYEIFQQAIIRPTVDFDRLEIVLVITNFSPLASDIESAE